MLQDPAAPPWLPPLIPNGSPRLRNRPLSPDPPSPPRRLPTAPAKPARGPADGRRGPRMTTGEAAHGLTTAVAPHALATAAAVR